MGATARCVRHWLIGLAVLVGSACDLEAQGLADSLARHGVFVELGGPGEIYSINYERLVGRGWLARAGATHWSFTDLVQVQQRSTKAIVGVTRLIDLSSLPGQHGTWIEVGLAASAGRQGFRSSSDSATGPWLAGNGIAGVRLQGAGRGWTFRAAYSPVYVLNTVGYALPKGFSHQFAASIGWVW